MHERDRPRVGGLVLAAGGGRRFGATKQLAPFRGRPLLEHAVAAMLRVEAVRPVVVVLGHAAEEVRAGADLGAARVAVCPGWAEGLAASVRTGVQALGSVEAAVVVLGDQPLVTPQAIAAVLDVDERLDTAVRATHGGEPGHPVLLPRRLLDRVGELEGDAGFGTLLRGERFRGLEAAGLCDPTDVDTPADLSGLGG